MSIPEGFDGVTPQWLTETFRAKSVIPEDARVVSSEVERIGEGIGFVGQIARLRLRYDRDVPAAPRSVIAKLPSADEGARAMANLYGLFEREVRFYAEVGRDVGLGTAHCYYAASDPAADRYLLLLEDLAASGRMGDQVAGCTHDEAVLAVQEAARMHAAWWQSPRLASFGWMNSGADLVRAGMTFAYPEACPKTLQMFGAHLDERIQAVAEGLAPRVVRLIDEIAGEAPMTMVHGDYRLDNMFFGEDGAPYRFAVIDWQSPNRGWGAYDLAYFLSGNMPAERRKECERDVLAAYHDALTEAGVRGYSREQLWEDYRRSLLVYLGIFMVSGALLEITNDRAVALTNAIFERLSAAIMDLDALDLLPA